MPNLEPEIAPPKSNPDKPFQREFQFISALDKGARKKSRVHVTKEFYRERRWKQINNHKTDEARKQEVPLPPTPEFVVSVTKLEVDRTSKDAGPSKSVGGSRASVSEGKKPNHEEENGEFSSIVSLLGAGRVDPFQSYPIEATFDVHQLVDHYHVVIPSLLHKQWGRRITHPMPIMDLFEVYRQDAASFLGMLHHAAHHLAKLRGGEVDSEQIISYKYQTLKILNERLGSMTGPYDDYTIVAVGLLANAERIWGDKETARMHWGATKRMILDRGGFPAFTGHHLVHTKLIWSFIALSGAWPIGNPAYVDSFAESVAIESTKVKAEPRSAFGKSCDEFVQFFTTRKANALRALPAAEADRAHHRKYPLRSTCFRPGTGMFRVLSRVHVIHSYPERRRAVDNCRLACLIYLNCMLLEYGDFSASTENFFQVFLDFIEDDDLDCALSAEHLLWSLIRGIEPHDTNKRTWKVSRMIGVMKRANQGIWWEVEEALRMFLIMPEDGTELIERIAAWDTETFRREILSFPDIERFADSNQSDFPSATNSTSTHLGSADVIDFLPETRDVQWFPGSTAAAESGVQPHKLYLNFSAMDAEQSNLVEPLPASLPLRQIQSHTCGAGCQICKLKPANY